jgi:hydrogenase maturation protein HypF
MVRPHGGGAGVLEPVGLHIEVHGTVQGVGFRPWVYRVAREEGLRGWVRNDSSGVTIEAFGAAASLASFCRRLRSDAPSPAAVRWLRSHGIPPRPARDFVIAPSREAPERRVSIPADRATCDECLKEIFDPGDRRYRYPFTNCTRCGPRYTLATRIPYDRANTTMDRFALCPDCRREYEDPADRRFHAEPNACPACGPSLRLLDAEGRRLAARDPLDAAAHALARGRIVAIKGLGGYHLACDAGDDAAVLRLRARKGRERKPFAVMVRDLDTARRLARLADADVEVLGSPERPIALVERRPDAALCEAVAPDLPLLGLLLPYTPLHHLLLAALDRPLVMTSGNRSDEPIVHRDDEAPAALAGIADLFLAHDRPIAGRCDDSVARAIDGRRVVLRRARGWVPRPIALHRPVERPVLGCGAHLKNTLCLAVGDTAFLGPHVGDLESLDAYEALEEAAGRLERFVGVAPERFACDLHPAYLSTRYARARAGADAIGVQHHHAHVASALAEHGLGKPVLGLAWDGTGDGGDGTAWGGELLLAEPAGFERLATFRPLTLAGGDSAVREVWRTALAVLLDAFDGRPPLDALPLFAALTPERLRLVRQMLERGVNTTPAHGVGRLFDAVGALALARPVSHYEGEVALRWNLLARPTERAPYPFALGGASGSLEIDWRPLVRALTADLLGGVALECVSGRFHETLAVAAETVVREAAQRVGRHAVVLTGGCFQNALLAARVAARLAPDFTVLCHSEVPPGDGGLALGQVLVADAIARERRNPPCA